MGSWTLRSAWDADLRSSQVFYWYVSCLVCVCAFSKKKNSPSCFYMLISPRVSPWILLMVLDILSYSSACNPLLLDIHGSVVPLKCLQAVTHRCLLQLPVWGPNHTNVFCLISKSDETEISSLGSPQIALLSWRRGWNSGCVLLTAPCYSREWGDTGEQNHGMCHRFECLFLDWMFPCLLKHLACFQRSYKVTLVSGTVVFLLFP